VKGAAPHEGVLLLSRQHRLLPQQHREIKRDRLRLVGQPGHASDPSLGNSALEGMQEVMGEILAWRRELQEVNRHPAFAVPVPTINLGHIHGGDNPNRICGDCELLLDLRVLPGLSVDELRAQLAARVARVAERRGLGWQVTPLFEAIPPAETPRHFRHRPGQRGPDRPRRRGRQFWH